MNLKQNLQMYGECFARCLGKKKHIKSTLRKSLTMYQALTKIHMFVSTYKYLIFYVKICAQIYIATSKYILQMVSFFVFAALT